MEFKRLDKLEITEDQFKQIMDVENSTSTGYSEEIMKSIWLEDEKDDNFVCIKNDRIVGHISFNPKSMRRNGSIYMVNLTVLGECRNQGIAQNLIYAACMYYKNKGVEKLMSLQVDKDNIPALSLYKKVGYEIKDPVCEADEDDEQYVMDSSIDNIIKTIESNIKKRSC